MSLPALKEDKQDSQLFDLGVERQDLGQPDSLRYNILTSVLDGRYDRAIESLNEFFETPSGYPNFQSKISRYVKHCSDLIYAIRAKRSFPGINSLTRAKQQELREKFKEHFKELQQVLKIIEKIHTDLRIRDARSTIYVVRAAWLSTLSIVVFAFLLEFTGGLAKTGLMVSNDIFSQLANWLTGKIGF